MRLTKGHNRSRWVSDGQTQARSDRRASARRAAPAGERKRGPVQTGPRRGSPRRGRSQRRGNRPSVREGQGEMRALGATPRPGEAERQPASDRLPALPAARPDRPLLRHDRRRRGRPGLLARPASRAYYRDLFEPLLDRRRLLVVDLRGTGSSEPIRCPQLQSLHRQLHHGRRRAAGASSATPPTCTARPSPPATWSPCSTTSASGASTSTATRTARSSRRPSRSAIPDRLRTLMLDARLLRRRHRPVVLRHQPRPARRVPRSPASAARPARGDPAARCGGSRGWPTCSASTPVVGRAPDADGVVRRVRVDVGTLIDLVTAAATTPTALPRARRGDPGGAAPAALPRCRCCGSPARSRTSAAPGRPHRLLRGPVRRGRPATTTRSPTT